MGADSTGSEEGQELREGERRRAGSSSPPPKADRHTSVMHYRPEHKLKILTLLE